MTTAIDSIPITGLSIRLLERGQPFESQVAVEVFIREIISKKAEDTEINEGVAYQRVSLSKWKIEEHQQFHAQFYFAKRPITSRFSQWIESVSDGSADEFGQVQTDSILFLYRQRQPQAATATQQATAPAKATKQIPTLAKKTAALQKKQQQATTVTKVTTVWELFALTTNQGGRVVKPYTSYRFPINVALRLLSPELSTAQRKPLTGETSSYVEVFRDTHSLKGIARDTIWNWFKGFKSHFKLGCSIYNPRYKMDDFTRNNEEDSKIAVEVAAGKLQIMKPLTMQQMVMMLSHFSSIHAGEQTYRITDEEKEQLEESDPGLRHLDNIQLVGFKEVAGLNQTLLKIFWNCYKEEALIGGLYLSHSMNEFFNSGTYCLKYHNQIIEWNARPSLSQIIKALRTFYHQQTLSNFDAFCIVLQDTKFGFKGKSAFQPLSTFIHGELRYEGNLYFRIDHLWLQVKADQLMVMHRDFFQLLQTSLCTDKQTLLSLSWIAKSEWASFTAEKMQEECGVTRKVGEAYIKALSERTFTFVDEDGFVVCQPSRALLEKIKHKKKLLNEHWEEIQDLFTQKNNDEEKVTEEDLVNALKTEKKSIAQNLLVELKKKRPILIKLSEGEIGKIALLDPQGLPRFPNMNNFKNNISKTAKTYQLAINRLLKEKFEKKEAITKEDLKKLKGDKGNRKISDKKRKGATESPLDNLWEAFQTPKDLAEPMDLETDRLLMQGPLPESSSLNQKKLNAYFKKRFADQQLIGPEQHYNRLYLQLPGYLVLDKVCPENIELCDILHYGTDQTKTPLSLIHVKEGFGQPTREACAQIRIAATSLYGALNASNEQMLSAIYQAMTDSKADSLFRNRLQKRTVKDFPNQKSFIKLFQDKWKTRQIQFVYAFIDDAKAERWLFNTQNFAAKIEPEELAPFTSKQNRTEQVALMALLKDKKILSSEGRLLSTALHMTQKQFVAAITDTNEISKKNAAKIDQFLLSRSSQFDSLGAKIELLELDTFLRNRGFTFKICQIPRTSKGYGNVTQTANWNNEIRDEDWSSPPATQLEPPAFQYQGVSYKLKQQRLDDRGVLALLLNVKPDSVGLGLYQVLNQQQEISDDKQSLDVLARTNFTREDWERVAALKGIKVMIFSKNSKGEITTESPEIVHTEGESTVYLVQSKEIYQRAFPTLPEADQKRNEEPRADTLPLSAVLTETDRTALLTNTRRIGLANNGNDCFFNAIFQLILNSPLLSDYLLDQANRKKEGGTIAPSTLDFFDFWQELALNYHLTARSGKKVLEYDRNQMRKLLGFSGTRQQDASDALLKIFKYYKDLILVASGIQINIVDLTKKQKLSQRLASISQADEKGMMEVPPDTNILLGISLPEKGHKNFDALIQSSLDVNREVEEKRKFSLAGDPEHYFVPNYVEKASYKCIGDEVLLLAKRMLSDKKIGDDGKPIMVGIKKIPSKLGMKAVHQIGDHKFSLNGFVTHLGNDLYSGHYIAICKTELGWFKFNDAQKPEKLTEKEAIAAANDAYILHFKKVIPGANEAEIKKKYETECKDNDARDESIDGSGDDMDSTADGVVTNEPPPSLQSQKKKNIGSNGNLGKKKDDDEGDNSGSLRSRPTHNSKNQSDDDESGFAPINTDSDISDDEVNPASRTKGRRGRTTSDVSSDDDEESPTINSEMGELEEQGEGDVEGDDPTSPESPKDDISDDDAEGDITSSNETDSSSDKEDQVILAPPTKKRRVP